MAWSILFDIQGFSREILHEKIWFFITSLIISDSVSSLRDRGRDPAYGDGGGHSRADPYPYAGPSHDDTNGDGHLHADADAVTDDDPHGDLSARTPGCDL